jgi:hypothetical protein
VAKISLAGNDRKLPKSEHSAPEWQAVLECLILVAEKNGPTMMARIGVMRALNQTATSSAFSIPTGKTRIGDGESWQGIDDSPPLRRGWTREGSNAVPPSRARDGRK